MRRTMAALAALGLLAAAAPTGAREIPPPRAVVPTVAETAVIVRPDWAEKPSGEDIARYYPERAQRMEKEGSATILCRVDVDGRLWGCAVVAESPEGFGFGDATVKLAERFRMKPMTLEGAPVDGASVRIPVIYKLPSKTDAEQRSEMRLKAFAAWVAEHRSTIDAVIWGGLSLPIALLAFLVYLGFRKPRRRP